MLPRPAAAAPRLVVVRLRPAVLRVRLAVLRVRLVPAEVALALVRGRLVAFLAVPPVSVLLRARFAEPLRAAVRVVVCAGIDLPPVVINYGSAIPRLTPAYTGNLQERGEGARSSASAVWVLCRFTGILSLPPRGLCHT
jgi:hypothetical protein